ncbi:MAG: hypothetical protein JEZ07_09450 [Phycisphaerae bacterium]|nr:hypothetical protein [Phycisphaerae bacterium]
MSDLFHVLSDKIKKMEREAVMHELLHFDGQFKLDYTKDYLETLATGKLRHILLAAMLQKLEPTVRHYS